MLPGGNGSQCCKNVNDKARSGLQAMKTKLGTTITFFLNYDIISVLVAVFFRENVGANNLWFHLNSQALAYLAFLRKYIFLFHELKRGVVPPFPYVSSRG